MKTRIKFCGCTSLNDVLLAAEAGADAVGMIFAPSPRRIDDRMALEIAAHLPPFLTPVGVFVDPTADEIARVRDIFTNLVVQLHGDEPPSFVDSMTGPVIKAIHVASDAARVEDLERAVQAYPQAQLLFDSANPLLRGGTGVPFAWELVAPIAGRRSVVVAGGLSAENVETCIRTARPHGVDVRSGVETGGKKDRAKMRAFVQAVKEADAA